MSLRDRSVQRSNFKQFQCKSDCDKRDLCQKFRQHMELLGRYDIQLEVPANSASEVKSDHENTKKELTLFLKDERISLMAELCHPGGQSVMLTLLTVNDGCEIIREQLDNLLEVNCFKEDIVGVTVRCGKLFDEDKPANQSRILAELLGIRDRTEQGRSYDALTALIKHPVLIVFTREKWEKGTNFVFFLHLR